MSSIDVQHEEVFTFAELAKRLPRRRRGRPVAASTLHRWRKRGLRGVRLEAVRVGGVWCTSWSAFQDFCERLTRVEQPTSSAGPLPDADVERELDKRGV